MALARLCDHCGAPLAGRYYDVLVQRKDAQEVPMQDAESVSGDYCQDCACQHAVRELLSDPAFAEEEAS
jgi:hypothetical protein